MAYIVTLQDDFSGNYYDVSEINFNDITFDKILTIDWDNMVTRATKIPTFAIITDDIKNKLKQIDDEIFKSTTDTDELPTYAGLIVDYSYISKADVKLYDELTNYQKEVFYKRLISICKEQNDYLTADIISEYIPQIVSEIRFYSKYFK